MVASIIMNSLSASAANVSKMRANTPLLHHRRYRLWVGFVDADPNADRGADGFVVVRNGAFELALARYATPRLL